MKDTRETTPTAWSDHPGYDLTKYTLSCFFVNDLDKHHPRTIDASVKATKFTGGEHAYVHLALDAGVADMQARMSPGNAREIANALMQAADIVDAYNAEADQLRQKEDTELARYNAGPLTTRVDIAQGVVAFEPAQTQGGAA